MIEYNPKNELLKKQYEEYLLHAKYQDVKTVSGIWKNLNLFEEFTEKADFFLLDTQQAMGFKTWLEKRANKHQEPLSISTICSVLKNVREFYYWLASQPSFLKKIDTKAVEYLHLSNKQNRAAQATREKYPPTIEEVTKVLGKMSAVSDIEKRDRALIAFTAITGVRDSALISLKQKDLDIKNKTVWQNPNHVKTKFSKPILTRFVPISPLAEEVALEWAQHCSDKLKLRSNDPLFPSSQIVTKPETMKFEVVGLSREHWANAQPVRTVFKAAFTEAGLPYYNPHLFRKMIVKWAMKNCSQYEFKAISQNIGHEYCMTTYNVYGKISDYEQVEAIGKIGQNHLGLQNISIEEILKEVARRTQK